MSKIIYVCAKNNLPVSIEKRLQDICKNLAPDNITPSKPKISISENSAYGIMNPVSSILESGNSVLIGQLFEKKVNWAELSQDLLDGSYALFRDGGEYFEIVSDPVASRTIWYYMDKEIFISSTSQRAITMFIGSFEFDDRVIPWILSTGSLGPSFSWDKRIKRVPPDSSVILNRKEWSISGKSNPIEFIPLDQLDDQHEQLLRESLESTFESLNCDFSSWVLPLSGGVDSRGILCLLRKTAKDFDHLKTITWGLESSLHEEKNDAYVAKELANALKVSHKYYHTNLSEEPIEKIINRFILLGEGRIDHIAGYMDGFEIWKTLFEEGVQGVIRGDHGFSSKKVSSPSTVRHKVGCALCSDFSNLRNYKNYGFATQKLPENLLQKKGEKLEGWRDRLIHEFRLPAILSSLTDLKLPYVELINPLLSRKILQQVRQLPDHLRSEKTLIRKIIISLSPDVDFATQSATASTKNILKQKNITHLIEGELSSKNAKSIFPTEFLDTISNGLNAEQQTKTIQSGSSSLKSFLKRFVPKYIKNAIRKNASLPKVDHNILAFRVFLISRMNAVLIDDSNRVRVK